MHAPDLQALKARLKAVWMSGDYGTFAKHLEPGALEFFARLDVAPGTRILDVGCGAGQIALPAARAGARVTGVDIATNLIEQARQRADAAGLDICFDEGDAEELRYENGSFDLVVSLIGAIFAPRPQRVAAELIRVCRPGGRIVMANWTPQGFNGKRFEVVAKHVPPPASIPSPMLWGDERVARERLCDGIAQLRMTRRLYPFHFPFPPAQVVDHFRTYYGPVRSAFAALDADGQLALHRDLEALWTQYNQATDDTTRYDAEYLEVVAIRQ